MIGRTLVFLREHLDELLRSAFGEGPDEPTSDKVVFLDGDQLEPLTFKLGAVSELLINVEEERLMSRGDPYTRRIEEEGKAPIIQRVQPDIRLILYVLFVARFKQYDAAWDHLSRIIEHFQVTRMFERETAPGLPEGVERLVLELVTLSFAEQNEVWNALRITHHPSILYRVKLLVLRDRAPRTPDKVDESVIRIERIP